MIVVFLAFSFPHFVFFSHSRSQPRPFSLLGLQQVSSVGYRHGGCRPSCGVTSLRGMLHVRDVRGGRGVPRERKPTKTEPLPPANHRCASRLCSVFHQSTQVCAAPARTHTCCIFSHTLFTCKLGVVTWCWSAHMLPNTLICSYMISFFPHCFLWKGVMLTADSAKGFYCMLIAEEQRWNRLLAQAMAEQVLLSFHALHWGEEWGSTYPHPCFVLQKSKKKKKKK